MPSPAVTSPFKPLSRNTWVALPPMLLKSAFTAMPVLAGPTPGVTATVNSEDCVTAVELGVANPTPEGDVGTRTVNAIVAIPVRDCASPSATGIDLLPATAFAPTVVLNENTLSPASASPFKPSSWNGCVELPPMALRLAVTVRPVLSGLVPGVTLTVNSTASPRNADGGVAEPVPVSSLVATD